MNTVFVGPFGMEPRGTMRERALPIGKALAARGHRVRILLPPWQNPEAAGRRWSEGGVTVENVRLPARIPGLFHASLALRLARSALRLRPEVVYLFKPKAFSGMTHWLLSRLPRSKRPWLVVDTDDWEGAGGWNELGGYAPLQRRVFAWQERWGLTHADAVTVASRTLESLVWSMGTPPERVFYVPNGVAGETCGDAGLEERGGEERCSEGAWTGCILLYTRFFEFPVSRVLDVLARVRERVPDAWLLVVGEGLFGEEEELFRLAGVRGLTVAGGGDDEDGWDPVRDATAAGPRPDIAYAGWVRSEDVPFYFAGASVAIYPFDDTLVNRAKCAVKLRDLLAAGVPVVAEAVGQNREYIRDGETGLLVEPGDVRGFGDGVARILSSSALRNRLGRAAARDMRDRFAWNRLVGIVEEALRPGA